MKKYKECKVVLDDMTKKIVKNFDYDFDGKTVFECIEKPKNPEDYNIGVIHGASGSGKSTLLAEYGEEKIISWDQNKSIISHFENEKDAVEKFTAVGLGSVPTWCKPYHVLSTGEKFRATLAMNLVDGGVVDEYTSVVNRTVAMSASIALARYARKKNIKITIATCHEDVLEWLEPDWSFDTKDNSLVVGRCLQRQPIRFGIVEGNTRLWYAFKNHHYLTGNIQHGAKTYLCCLGKEVVGFSASIPLPGKIPPYFEDEKTTGKLRRKWREHRLVVLPDYQGIGIGVRFSDLVGQLFFEKKIRYFSKTAHPRMGEYRQNSKKWRATATNLADRSKSGCRSPRTEWHHYTLDTKRICYSHEYIGDLLNREV